MRPGTELGGRYRLDCELGRGAMGEVWRAHDRMLGREVAIKLMLSDQSDTEALERFRREAVMSASLQHPGIIVIHDAGLHDGRLFIVMELLTGEDLRGVLARHPSGLPPARAMMIAGQAAGALAVVHGRGIVHRDLKPENLFIRSGDRVKICDFGIARDNDMPTLTAVGQQLGTPKYMAPERWEGLAATAATDLYALGCVLYEMLTGKPPFDGMLTAVIGQHLKVAPVAPDERVPGLPGQLSDLVMALLAKDPARRPPGAAAVSSALRRMVRDLLSTPLPRSDPPRTALTVPSRLPSSGVTAPLGCAWVPGGGCDVFLQDGPAGLRHARLRPAGDWGGWHRMQAPDGQVSAIAVGAARVMPDWDSSAYEFHRGLVAAVGGTVFHSLHVGEGSRGSGPGGGWSVWEAMRPLAWQVVDLALAAYSAPGQWSVFALDAAGLIHHRVLAGDTEWTAIPGPPGRAVTAIAACYREVPELVAVADGALWRTRQFQSGRWQEWEAVARPAQAADVALSPLGAGGELLVLDQTAQVRREPLGPSEPGRAEVPRLGPGAGKIRAIAASPMLAPGSDRGHVLCALASDGTLHWTSSRAARATWSAWQPLPPR